MSTLYEFFLGDAEVRRITITGMLFTAVCWGATITLVA